MVRLVEDDEDVGLALLEVPVRLRLVVEAEDGRSRAAAQDLPARVEAGGEAGEPERAALLGRRPGVDAKAGLSDDAQRALAADEELGQVRSRGGTGPLALGAHDAAVRQDHLESDDHVLDLPVTGRVLPGAAAGQPAADGREVHGLGPVAEGVALTDLAEGGLEIRTECSGSHVGGQGHLIHLAQTGDPGHVQGNAAVHGYGAPAHAAAAGRGGHGHERLVTDGEHARQPLRSRRGGPPPPGVVGRRPRRPSQWRVATSLARPRPGRRRRPGRSHRWRRCARAPQRGPRRCPRRGDRRRPPRRHRWA